jgi:membrane protein DedA with SNARE-associated domain
VLQNLFDRWGWWGVSGLMVFENATGITPSEVVLGLAGWFLLSAHDLSFGMVFLGGLYTAIGSVIGASITYWAARLGGRPLIERLAGWLRFNPAHICRAEEAFQRRGAWMVLFGRMIPGIRTLISIPAGLACMRFSTFLATTFVGAYLWCTLLIGLGYFLGEEWELFSALFRRYALVFGGVIVTLAFAWLVYRWWHSRTTAETTG